MKKLLLISLITLQGCTSLKSAVYWFEHSENMMMPEHYTWECPDCGDMIGRATPVNNTECPRPGDF